MTDLLADPWFYAAAVPAVILVGLSKGGFGGAMGFVGVPLMALVMPPVQAAAILLPILVLMDIVSLWSWRGVYDRSILRTMLPGSMVGIGIGWLTAALVTAGMVRFIVGAVAIVFVGRWLYQQIPPRRRRAARRPTGRGAVLGHGRRLHQLRRPCRRSALPGLHPAARARPEGLHRHQRHLLRHHQRGEAHSLFRARPVRHHQPRRLGRADAAGAAGDARRRHGWCGACGRKSSIRSPTPRSAMIAVKLVYDGVRRPSCDVMAARALCCGRTFELPPEETSWQILTRSISTRTRRNHQPLTPLTFLERAAKVLSRPVAIVHGGRRITYRDFWRRSLQLASALRRQGIGKGDTVSVMLSNTPAMLEAHFGVPMVKAVLHSPQHAARRGDHRLPARPCRIEGADRRPRVLRRGQGGAGAGQGEAAGDRL